MLRSLLSKIIIHPRHGFLEYGSRVRGTFHWRLYAPAGQGLKLERLSRFRTVPIILVGNLSAISTCLSGFCEKKRVAEVH